MLDIIDVLSLAGARQKPNDDVFGLAGNRVWVIDGATGLGDPIVSETSDAAWLAHRASQLFSKHSATDDTLAMMEAVALDLEFAFLREQRRPARERWEIPCGAFMLLTARGGGVCELAWTSDCRAILIGADGELHSFGATPASEAREAGGIVGAPSADPAERFRTPEAQARLRAGRARYNAPGGPFTLAPDRAFVQGVKIARVSLKAPGQALLMTDGFAALELRYGEIGASDFVAEARAQGLAKLAIRLREIEEKLDPAAVRFPRWKRSDDATAALVAIA